MKIQQPIHLTKTVFLYVALPLVLSIAGCKQVLHGYNPSDGQITEVGAEAAVQIESQYAPALTNTPGLDQMNSAVPKLTKITGKLPSFVNIKFEGIESAEQLSISLPDGHVFISSGLLQTLAQDPSTIDALVAHEIGHIALQHDLINLTSALGETDLSSELADGRYQDVVNTEIELGKLSYSRDQEFAADDYALGLLSRSSDDPTSLPRLVKIIDAEDHSQDTITWDLMHPIGHGRLARLYRQLPKKIGAR